MKPIAFIDAQFILRRNTSGIKKSLQEDGKIEARSIYLSVLRSILILQERFDFLIPILLWDKSPYIKSQNIPSYKGDRFRISEEYVESQKKVVSFSKYEELKRDLLFERTVQEAKQWIIDNMEEYGFYSLYLQGYEADDFAFTGAYVLEEKNLEGLIVSIDSDWLFYVSKTVELQRLTKGYPRYNIDKVFSEHVIENVKDIVGVEVPLSAYKIIRDIFYGNHDNLPALSKKSDRLQGEEGFKILLKSFAKKQDLYNLFPELYEDIIKIFHTLFPLNFVETLRGGIEYALTFRANILDPVSFRMNTGLDMNVLHFYNKLSKGYKFLDER